MSPEFLATALIVVLAPGTGAIYTLATGLTQGRRAAVAASVGCTFGIVPAMLAAILGLAAILHTSALAFQIVKFAGAAFLPQFLTGNATTATTEMLTLGATFMAMTFMVFVAYGTFAALARDRVLSSPRAMTWLRRSFAAAFAGLGLKLALEKA